MIYLEVYLVFFTILNRDCLINNMDSDQRLGKKDAKKQKQQRKLEQAEKKHKEFQKEKGKSQSQEDQEEGADIDLNQIQEGQAEERIDVDFIIGQINDDYYHSLKTILLRMGQITKVTNAELADAIVANKKIGNVSLADDQDDQEEEEDEDQNAEDDEQNVYSVLTVLPGDLKVSKAIRKTVNASAEKQKLSEELKKIIRANQTNILINQRLSNLPAEIVSYTHKVFKKDMTELKKTDQTLYKKLLSTFLINVSEVQYQGSPKLEDLIFSKFQDYEMCKRAKHWWLGQKNQTYKKKAEMKNLYYIISGEEYLKGVDNIESYLE